MDQRYVGAWSRLATTVLGTATKANPAKLNGNVATSANKQASVQRAQAMFTESVARGEPLERALYRSVETLIAAQDRNSAWALAEGVGRLPGGSRASAVGHALLLHRGRQFRRVWNRIHHLSDDDLAAYLPVEAVDGALATGTSESHVRARAIAARTEHLSDDQLVDLAGRFLAVADTEPAATLMAELRRRPPFELDERRMRSARLIEMWLERRPRTLPPGSLPVAVIDYQTPDQVLASGNLGDYIQTLSLMGNLVRLSNVTFSGEDGLGELAAELQNRVQTDLRMTQIQGSIHLLDINREFSRVEDIPESTWMIAFGWHMHPLYDLHYDFPYHRNIRPVFVSFHVNRLDMLTEEAIAYLRKYAPVGCRDWTTVDLLLSAGVDAFFTGCLTTTVDALFPAREQVYDGGGVVGAIDTARPAPGPDAQSVRVFTHQSDEYRHMSLTEGVRAAAAVLADYQRTLERATTRRLHAYLPLTALGIPVDFKPWSSGDVRFPGLTGLTPGSARLAHIQDGIRELTSRVLAKAMDGVSDEEVYAFWRELTVDRVAAAKARHVLPVASVVTTTIDVDAAVRTSKAESRRFGPHDTIDPQSVSEIVLCYDQNLESQAAVLVASMLDNATGPLRLWILGRGLDHEHQEWLALAFPSTPITFLPCDHVDYGNIARIPERITVSTMDRLLLPLLLEDVDRAVYLDVDTLVIDDICELAQMDLQNHPIAARDSNVSEASEWRAAARRLPEELAVELQRRMAVAHGYGRPALNAGVLVLDLDRMRRDEFTRTYLGWVERYGLHDQDVMLAYAGADRLTLDRRWNALPVLEDVEDPALIHWAKLGKPWETQLTYAQERWQHYAARVHGRTIPRRPPVLSASGKPQP